MLTLHLPTIPCLGRLCRPSAVARTIRAIIVDSVDAMFWRRSGAHVGKEVLERTKPALANRDPAPAVVLEIRSSSIVAPRTKVAPREPLWAYARPPCHPVGSAAHSGLLSPNAAAARACAIAKRRAVNGCARPAVTFAKPQSQFVAADYGPAPEPPSAHFYKAWHGMEFTTQSPEYQGGVAYV